MTDLNHIISTFSIEEQQQFVNYLQKKNKRNDTKNIQLFKLILKEDTNTTSICNALYGSQKKGAYHALRKRLYQSVIDFIANKNLAEENTVEMQLIKLLITSRVCLAKKQYKAAYKLLDKTEVIAQEHSLFSILNEVYHTKIEYSHTQPDTRLDDYILAYKNNQDNALLEDKLNIVYAKIRQSLNNINYKGAILDIETLLHITLKEQDISLENAITFKALYKIISIVSLSAFVTNDYYKIESFLLKSYKALKTHKTKENQLYYHIQILYMIANTLFRNKKFEDTFEYLKLMEIQLSKKKNKYYNSFILKHNLLKGLNYNYTNQPIEAITILENSTQKHQDIESVLDIHLSLTMFYMQQDDLKKAKHIISKFYHTDKYYESKAGKEWVIKKNLIDIILQIELGNIDLVDSRLRSFKRNHFDYLRQINQERAIVYLGFVEQYYKNPEFITSATFKDKVENAFIWIEAQREDIFVMSFYAWLKSKMENKSLYQTTLELVELSIPS